MVRLNYVCLDCRMVRRSRKLSKPKCLQCKEIMTATWIKPPKQKDTNGWDDLIARHRSYDENKYQQSYRDVAKVPWSLERHRLGVYKK